MGCMYSVNNLWMLIKPDIVKQFELCNYQLNYCIDNWIHLEIIDLRLKHDHTKWMMVLLNLTSSTLW